MTFIEKLELLSELLGLKDRHASYELRLYGGAIQSNGYDHKPNTKPFHITMGYTTSDTAQWICTVIVGEGDSFEEALDDALGHMADAAEQRGATSELDARRNEKDARKNRDLAAGIRRALAGAHKGNV